MNDKGDKEGDNFKELNTVVFYLKIKFKLKRQVQLLKD